jgi:hypothetical protein
MRSEKKRTGSSRQQPTPPPRLASRRRYKYFPHPSKPLFQRNWLASINSIALPLADANTFFINLLATCEDVGEDVHLLSRSYASNS